MSRHFFCLAVLFLFSNFTVLAADTISSISCPVNFSYIETYPWSTSACQNPYSGRCCQTLLAVVTMGFAQYLKETSNFFLPDVNYSFSCLLTLHAKLAAVSLQPALIPHCFHDPSQFVANCAGIQTIEDWNDNVGTFTPLLESSCEGDLTNLTYCDSCVAAGFEVTSQLMHLSKNNTNAAASCFYIVVLYAVGIVSDPFDTRTVPCLVGIETRDSSASKKPSKQLISGLVGVTVCISLVLGLSMFYKQQADKKKQDRQHQESVINIKGNLPPNLGAKWFDENELQHATNGFSRKNIIGQGAYGVVYRGLLSDGTSVAVKETLTADSVGDEEFFNEVEIVSKIRHKNLLTLRGYSVSSDKIHGRKRYLVYDFMSNGSLFDHLSSDKTRKQLTWPQRQNIILDVAKGLAYLHYGVRPGIYHRDIKATNKLLDSDMKAKVSDFGLAKQSKEGQSYVTTKVAGTHGYLAPEYALYGQLTEKSDVYSFGILVLETMSGRRVLGLSNSPFLLISDWTWMQIKSGKVEEVFDETLTKEGAEVEGIMERFVLVGLLCAHVTASFRPTIVEALSMLEGDTEVPEIPDRPLPVNSGLKLINKTVLEAVYK